MDLYTRRDLILSKLFEYSEESPAPSTLADRLGIPEVDEELVSADYEWLHNNGLLTSDVRPSLTPVGVNFVERRVSVSELAEQSVRQHVQNVQYNTNYGGQPINNMGDHVNITSNVTSGNIAEIAEALRVNGEEGRAVELESAEESHGTQSAIQKVLEWVKEKWINPAALTAVNGVLIAHGIAI